MTLILHASDSNSVLRRLHLVGTSYSGPIVTSPGTESIVDLTIKNWLVTNDIALGQHAKWGLIIRNCVRLLIQRLTGRGIDKEHLFYLQNFRGGFVLEGIDCKDIGAQGLQVTYRDIESDTPLGWQDVGVHWVRASRFERCGQPRGYGRASFALSFFGRQEGDGSSPRLRWDCPVRLENVHIVHDSLGAYELRGALLVEHRPKLEVIGGSTVYRGPADRDLWHIWQVDEVIVSGHHFEGQRTVDIDGAKRIVFTGCTGNVRLRVNGVDVGPVSDDFTFDSASDAIVGPGIGYTDWSRQYLQDSVRVLSKSLRTLSSFLPRGIDESAEAYAERVAWGDDGPG